MEYYCVFDKQIECSVKEAYKLTPESLNEFCKICKNSTSTLRDAKILEVLSQIGSTLLTNIMSSLKEREDLQYQLGLKTAMADMYKQLYEELKSK